MHRDFRSVPFGSVSFQFHTKRYTNSGLHLHKKERKRPTRETNSKSKSKYQILLPKYDREEEVTLAGNGNGPVEKIGDRDQSRTVTSCTTAGPDYQSYRAKSLQGLNPVFET